MFGFHAMLLILSFWGFAFTDKAACLDPKANGQDVPAVCAYLPKHSDLATRHVIDAVQGNIVMKDD